MQDENQKRYEELLYTYIEHQQEGMLYAGQQFCKDMIDEGIPPEKMISYHIEAMKRFPEFPSELMDSLQFLLEVMVGYGFQYRAHQSLLEKQIQLQSELEIAASVQQTLLPDIPDDVPGIDLGIISVAAKKMSGDYYHFYYHPQNESLGVAIADIIGKGIPAALCMSMIKYAIEGLPEPRLDAHILLENINRVVEKNIDPSMFITMIYGSYDLTRHEFQYATAGHEPALFYSAEDDQISDMTHKGVVLGLANNSTYTSFSVTLEPQDMVILFSDGVTESRQDGQFIDRKGLIQLIHQFKHLESQQMATEIHQQLLVWSDYKLQDDQTIIILKRMAK